MVCGKVRWVQLAARERQKLWSLQGHLLDSWCSPRLCTFVTSVQPRHGRRDLLQLTPCTLLHDDASKSLVAESRAGLEWTTRSVRIRFESQEDGEPDDALERQDGSHSERCPTAKSGCFQIRWPNYDQQRGIASRYQPSHNSALISAWPKYRRITRLFCNRKVSDKLKPKICRVLVRPMALYRSECRYVAKEAEHHLIVRPMWPSATMLSATSATV